MACSGVSNLGHNKSKQSGAETTSSNGWSVTGIALKQLKIQFQWAFGIPQRGERFQED